MEADPSFPFHVHIAMCTLCNHENVIVLEIRKRRACRPTFVLNLQSGTLSFFGEVQLLPPDRELHSWMDHGGSIPVAALRSYRRNDLMQDPESRSVVQISQSARIDTSIVQEEICWRLRRLIGVLRIQNYVDLNRIMRK